MSAPPGPESPNLEDRRLVQRFLEHGEEAAFRALYRRHASALNALLVRLMRGNAEEAEETLQECWLRAVQGLDAFRWDSTFRTWIQGIAVNCARERRRSLARDVQVDVEEPLVRANDGPIDPIDLEQAIAELPDGFREIVVLHDVEGRTHEEIGRMLGIATGTSKSQLSRARNALRKRLSEAEEVLRERRAR